MQGWFKIHRELFESDLWHDVSTLRLFLFLLAQASHKDGIKTKGIELQRGQYVRSYRKLADDLSYKEGRGYKKYSLSTIKSCVNKLIDAERVNVKETEAGTLFTILNYAKYQDFEDVEKESPNTQNEEVRTNAELTPNEVRTNSEQEQELKNLRIKELEDKKNSRKQVYDESSVHFRLADLLYQEILKNNPGHKKPNLQNWANDMRLMMERDDRTEEQISYLIKWCQRNEFWHKNILSVAKLREKFDQLIIQVKSNRGKVVEAPVYERRAKNEGHDGKHSTGFGNVRLFK